MIFKLKDVKPNTFRDLIRNPLIPAKIDRLKESITETGFWDNVVVRLGKDGKPEMAYGHHRIEAAKQAGITEADFIVKQWDDAMMLKSMSRENDDDYKANVLALLESVRAVVKALADQRIPEFEIDSKTSKDNIRYAPSFVLGVSVPNFGTHPYTTVCLAKFLGKLRKGGGGGQQADESVVATLNALHLIELKKMTEAEIKGWSVDQLLNETRARIKAYYALAKERQENSATLEKLHNEQIALDEKRRENTIAAKQKKLTLLRLEAEAKREADDKEAARLAKERKAAEEKEKARVEAFKEKREELDKKVEEYKEREKQLRKEAEGLPVRREAESLRIHLENIAGEGNPLRQRVKATSRMDLTQNERELIRQAALKVGTWFTEYVAMQFLPPKEPKKVLEEMASKEEARHRRGK